MPPFLRQEPKWIEEKLELCLFYQKKYIDAGTQWNVAIGNPLTIAPDDLKEDNLHLTDAGMEKLYQILESDILKCKDNLGEGQETLDWSTQVSNHHDAITPKPGTIKKRMRQDDSPMESESEENSGKKAKIDTVIDKLVNIDAILQELVKDRKENKIVIKELTEKVEGNSTEVEKVKSTVEEIEKKMHGENQLTAEMREDIDGLENENLKTTVVVRKLKAKAGEEVPKDKLKLRAYIQGVARKLVQAILNEEASKDVKYGAPLYSFQDPKKQDNKEGLVPPFKIGFGTKDVAVRFRDTAVKLVKEGGNGKKRAIPEQLDEEVMPAAVTTKNEYANTYFTFFQSAGTRVRLLLMWAVADAIKTDRSEVWVNQNTSKPTLQVKEGGKIVKTLSFVQTMNQYKEKLTKKTLEEATKIAKKSFAGQLEKTFLVIKD